MLKKSIFEFSDYKKAIQHLMAETADSWGLITRLAKAAGCQRSYLSRVLKEEAHLTADQLFGLCQYWKLSAEEVEYMGLLLQKDRSSSRTYREHLEQRIVAIRKRDEDLRKKVQRPAAEVGMTETLYYSTWLYSALHILVSIPRLQTARTIAEHLQLPLLLVENSLQTLASWGLVKHSQNKWVFSGREIHVEKFSPLVSLHHRNWRERAVLDAQNPECSGVHFTVVQSIDQKTWNSIKGALLNFIAETQREARPAKEEKLVCMTCDFFEV